MRKISLRHLQYLTDDFGVWQHTKGHKINRKYGYSLDDAARALLVAVQFRDRKMIGICLGFLSKAINGRRIVNFFNENRKPLPLPWSEDALGEAFWALEKCFSSGFFHAESYKLIKICLKYAGEISSIRGKAYFLLGAAFGGDNELTSDLACDITALAERNCRESWFWIEDLLRYANGIIPYSLLVASRILKNSSMQDIALGMLQFLNSETKHRGIPIAIGNKGWYCSGGRKALFDQQPIDPAYQTLANLEAWTITGSEYFFNEASAYFSWFWGNNIAHKSLINLHFESCYDGICKSGLNKNQGSENIICYLLAQEAIWPHLTTDNSSS